MKSSLFPLKIMLIVSLVVFGGFFEFYAAILTIALMVYLYFMIGKDKVFLIGVNLLLVLVIPFAYFVSTLFAVDSGIALIGAIKYMPIIPMAFIVSKLNMEERMEIVRVLPNTICVITIVTSVLSLVEPVGAYLNVQGRLGGSFQYPNTFALCILIAIIMVIYELSGENARKRKWFCLGKLSVLLAGMFLTGSRTALVILAIFALYSLFDKQIRKSGIILCSLAGVAVLVTLGYVLVVGEMAGFTRYLSTSVISSQFLGRILYYIDAIFEIVKTPLGLGYYGYLFEQGSFQTGVYAVTYVHNDFFQIFLDAGWIPGIAFVLAFVRSVLDKKAMKLQRVLLAFMGLYCLFDFHLQYLSIWMILLLLLSYRGKAIDKLKFNKKVYSGIAGIVIVVNLYFGVALFAEYINANDFSLTLYPYNNRIVLDELIYTQDVDEADLIADEILATNTSSAIVYDAKAEKAYMDGDFMKFVEYKFQQLELSRYDIGAYSETYAKLEIGVQLYMEAGSPEGAEFCEQAMDELLAMLEEVEAQTNSLAYLLDEKPEFEIQEIPTYVK